MTGQYGLVYRLLFFYIEPIFALGGSYLTHFSPQAYIAKTIPGNTDPIHTNTQLILTNLASQYIYFTIMEAWLLRITNDRRVWRTVIAATVMNDIIHLYGLYVARATVGRGLGFDIYRREDWEVFGPSYIPLILRLAFLAGFDGFDDRISSTQDNRKVVAKGS